MTPDRDVRLLSKSPLIKLIAQSLKGEQKRRVIFGLEHRNPGRRIGPGH